MKVILHQGPTVPSGPFCSLSFFWRPFLLSSKRHTVHMCHHSFPAGDITYKLAGHLATMLSSSSSSIYSISLCLALFRCVSWPQSTLLQNPLLQRRSPMSLTQTHMCTLTIGLVWQPMCHPLISLHQRPFKNATPITLQPIQHTVTSTPRRALFHERSSRTQCMMHLRQESHWNHLRACFIHGWTIPIATRGLRWLQPRFFGATTQLESSLFSFMLGLPICNKLGSYDIYAPTWRRVRLCLDIVLDIVFIIRIFYFLLISNWLIL